MGYGAGMQLRAATKCTASEYLEGSQADKDLCLAAARREALKRRGRKQPALRLCAYFALGTSELVVFAPFWEWFRFRIYSRYGNRGSICRIRNSSGPEAS
jgi:hypothetical protein